MLPGAYRPPTQPLSSYSTTASFRELDVNGRKDEASDSAYCNDGFAITYFKSYHTSSMFHKQCDAESLSRSVQWTLEHRKYQSVKQLGSGTYGTVYKAERRDREQHNAVAMKVCRIDQSPELGLPETAVREAALLVELRGHPNIMNLLSISCSRADKLYLVCELLEMDLKSYIKKLNIRRLPIADIKRIGRCILQGLAHCHSRGVLHRDLKPHNILISKDLSKVKIADFGLGRWVHSPQKTLTHEVVTLWYRPPEVLLGDCRYSEAVDIWSAGCVIAELVAGHALFQGSSEIETLFKIFRLFGTPSAENWPEMVFEDRSVFPTFPGDPSPFDTLEFPPDPDIRHLLKQMLSVSPSSRPSSWDCLNHPFLSDV